VRYKYNTIDHSKTNSAAAFHTIPALNGATHSIFSRKIKYLAQSWYSTCWECNCDLNYAAPRLRVAKAVNWDMPIAMSEEKLIFWLAVVRSAHLHIRSISIDAHRELWPFVSNVCILLNTRGVKCQGLFTSKWESQGAANNNHAREISFFFFAKILDPFFYFLLLTAFVEKQFT